MKKLMTLVLAFTFMIGVTVHAEGGMMCIQVMTYAQNPETLEWEIFPTPCDVPQGWRSSMTNPDGSGELPADDAIIIAPNPVVTEPYIDEPVIAPYNPGNGEGYITYYNADDDGKTVTLAKGDTLRIVLESNPSTGYSWGISTVDDAVLENTENRYESACDSAEMVGCGGEEVWDFKGIAAGTTTLEMAYYRSWESPETAVRTFTLTVEVAIAEADATYSEEDDGKKVVLTAGESLRVELESNPSTGYSWHVKMISENVLENTAGQYESDCASDSMVMGCGGKEVWEFKGIAAGETTLEMAYYRPWEEGKDEIETFTLTVQVKAADTDDAGSVITAPETSEPVSAVREDLKLRIREGAAALKTWKRECWASGSVCGDFNGDGELDRLDLTAKKRALQEAVKALKESLLP